MSNMFGESLPNVKIDKIMIENDGPTSIKIGVDLSITYINNTLLTALGNKDFLQFVKIKVVQSTNRYRTTAINLRNRESKNILLGNTNERHVVVEELPINGFIGSGTPTDIYSYKNSKGEDVNKLVFHKKFSLENNNPSHLSYFCFTYIDTRELNRQRNLNLNPRSHMGTIFAETAIIINAMTRT